MSCALPLHSSAWATMFLLGEKKSETRNGRPSTGYMWNSHMLQPQIKRRLQVRIIIMILIGKLTMLKGV
jgi:hypothetical protein